MINPAFTGSCPCPVCGAKERRFVPVLWDGLAEEWEISDVERAYIDRQQGEHCTICGANLRTMVLGEAILRTLGDQPNINAYLDDNPRPDTAILEINEAGMLHHTLTRFPNHVLGVFPQVDMQDMEFADDTFDIVCHSDTLEHVPDPRKALRECRRVLKPGGALCFTVPIIVGRMSRSREGLPLSYHGRPGEDGNDYQVQTEFGADAWCALAETGFKRISLITMDYPAAIAWNCTK